MVCWSTRILLTSLLVRRATSAPAAATLRQNARNDADSILAMLYEMRRLPTKEDAGVDFEDAAASFQQASFTQPIDHFQDNDKYAPHTTDTYSQRYWYSVDDYRPGGPVFLLDLGEATGDPYTGFFSYSILANLTKATGGIAVLLEQRYYGESRPFSDYNTDTYRFLDTEQALADNANFARSISFPEVDGSITSPGTPWIIYGGSYPGAKAAWSRVKYPDVFYGAIASSAVVEGILWYWDYFTALIKYANQDCINALEDAISHLDDGLLSGDEAKVSTMLDNFGADNATSLAADLAYGHIGDWQTKSPWGRTNGWDTMCKSITSLSAEAVDGSVPLGRLIAMYKSKSQRKKRDMPESDFKIWSYQYCSEQGFFQTGPPEGQPTIISRALTNDDIQDDCNSQFPPGQYNSLPPSPNVAWAIAQGGWSMSFDRLAFIDGEWDPWRQATVHSTNAPPRESTTLRPSYIIPGVTHAWDLLAGPGSQPANLMAVRDFILDFVVQWLDDWKAPSNNTAARHIDHAHASE